MLKKIWEFVKSPGPMAVLAIAGTAFGVYGTLFYERQASFAIDVLTNSPVFDLRTDVSQLGVTYAGVDLRKSSQTLRLVSVKITNTGDKDILKADFDEGEPISLVIGDGKIVEISRYSASNDFLKRRGKIQRISERALQISPVLLEKNEFMLVDFLVLADIGHTPIVGATGKIAGIKQLSLTNTPAAQKISVFTDTVHAETVWAQLLRGPVYFLGFFLEIVVIGIAVAIPMTAVDWVITTCKQWFRRQTIQKRFFGRQLSEVDQVCVEYFIENGTAGLAHLYKFLARIEERAKILSELPLSTSESEAKKILYIRAPVASKEKAYLLGKEIISVDGLRIDASPEFEPGLNNVCRVLELNQNDVRTMEDNSRFGSMKSLDREADMMTIRGRARIRESQGPSTASDPQEEQRDNLTEENS